MGNMYTLCGSQGTSSKDYQRNYFHDLIRFDSGNFHTFSDHDPISFDIVFDYDNVETPILHFASKSVRWSIDSAESIVSNLTQNTDRLDTNVPLNVLSWECTLIHVEDWRTNKRKSIKNVFLWNFHLIVW
jgi:hypothetical protein